MSTQTQKRAGRQQDGPLHDARIMPSLTVNNIEQSVDFFRSIGFEVEEKWEQDGALTGAMLKAGEARLGVNQDDGKKGQNRTKGVGFRLYVETSDNIDEVAARARSAGVGLKSDPHPTEWGGRVFDVEEPSGFVLTIGSQR